MGSITSQDKELLENDDCCDEGSVSLYELVVICMYFKINVVEK